MTKELSADTWSDFIDLFSRGNGWDHCACMYFQRGAGMPKATGSGGRVALQAENLRQKEQLVAEGRAHGVLVYTAGAAIGWCQFGPSVELPLGIPASRRKEQARAEPDWRVTCFVTDKRYRQQGVAQIALRAAIDAIDRKGGGVVEGYPVAGWTRGEGATDPGDHVQVDGLGAVVPAFGTYGFVSTQGTVSMFTAEGFTAVGTVRREWGQKVSGRPPESHVVMRRMLAARRA